MYRVSHGKVLKLIGNYFEMHPSIEMAQIAFKRRHFKVFLVHNFIIINNIFIHLFNILKSINLMINIFEVFIITTRATINSFSKNIQKLT